MFIFLKELTPTERTATLSGGSWFFFILSAYYFLRPLRETMGTIVGAENLHKLFFVVFLVMILLVPLYSVLVAKLSRKRLVPTTYRLFSSWLVVFAYIVYREGEIPIWLAKVFYVWLSVFSLFVVSIFWSVMTDAFNSSQSKRLFGIMAAGGSLGGLCSSVIVSFFGDKLPVVLMLVLPLVLLEFALIAARYFENSISKNSPITKPTGGSALQGFQSVMSSPYLLLIGASTILGKICATGVYLRLLEFVQREVPDIAERTQMFATENLIVQIVTLLFQFFLTAQILKRLSLSWVLTILPITLALGFIGFSLMPLLYSALALQIVSRILSYGLMSPSGEVLFTVVPREDRYKAKSFLDTFIKRGGDVMGSRIFSAAQAASIPSALFSTGLIAFSLAWAIVGFNLGKMQKIKEKK